MPAGVTNILNLFYKKYPKLTLFVECATSWITKLRSLGLNPLWLSINFIGKAGEVGRCVMPCSGLPSFLFHFLLRATLKQLVDVQVPSNEFDCLIWNSFGQSTCKMDKEDLHCISGGGGNKRCIFICSSKRLFSFLIGREDFWRKWIV